MLGNRRRHSLAAGQAAHEQMPSVALVLMTARRTDRRPAVAAAHVGVPVQLVGRGVPLEHLASGGVDQHCRTPQPHRTCTAGPPPDRGLDPRLPEQGRRQHLLAAYAAVPVSDFHAATLGFSTPRSVPLGAANANSTTVDAETPANNSECRAMRSFAVVPAQIPYS